MNRPVSRTVACGIYTALVHYTDALYSACGAVSEQRTRGSASRPWWTVPYSDLYGGPRARDNRTNRCSPLTVSHPYSGV